MTQEIAEQLASRKTLRLWPGLLIVSLQWLGRFALPIFIPAAAMAGVLGGLAGGAAIVVWWLLFSKATWPDRLLGVVAVAVALVVTPTILHPSIATGMMGLMFLIYAVPVLSLVFVIWAVVAGRMTAMPRRIAMVATVFLAAGSFALLRTEGIDGHGRSDFHWRWTQTPEQKLLASSPEDLAGSSEVATNASTIQWHGFRGPHRNGVVADSKVQRDWKTAAPQELWRQPVGPGWSSFAVSGNVFYTQEQRGDEEVVSCYLVATGQPVWRHGDDTRFWESNAGAGPRATPTLAGDRVYSLGATGILNALNARDGSVVWSRNAADDTQCEVPGWGFSASPLLMGDLVVVGTAGKLAGYDAASGDLRWLGPTDKKGGGYSSPHAAVIHGIPQILWVFEWGVISLAPGDGKPLWEYAWRGDGIVQPALTPDGDVLIGAGSGMGGGIGILRIAVSSTGTIEERWNSPGLKPYFNDFVVHGDRAFGFDGSILACINLADGERVWKGGRYGNGQLIVLGDQDLLVVVTEKGELALVDAAADQFKELGRVAGIAGKTWNHPVLVGDILLVRNSEEMAAFRLPSIDD